jgi:hypothetical protein
MTTQVGLAGARSTFRLLFRSDPFIRLIGRVLNEEWAGALHAEFNERVDRVPTGRSAVTHRMVGLAGG